MNATQPQSKMDPKQRKKIEGLLWKFTHTDFKGKIDGVRTVLHLIPGKGTCSVSLDFFSDEDLLAKLPARVRATL